MFQKLTQIMEKPDLYSNCHAEVLWNDPYISQQMLKTHLDPATDLASRRPEFIDASVDFMRGRFDLRKGKSVIDFGCGPGLYTIRFAAMGCQVRGLDFSENSIRYAIEESARSGFDIDYRYINYLDYVPDQLFDLATMIYCDFCVLNKEQRKNVIGIMRDSTKDDGHIFLDVVTNSRYQNIREETSFEIFDESGFWTDKPHYVFKSVFKYDDECVTLDKYTVIAEDKEMLILNWLKHYTLSTLAAEFADCGLEIAGVYADVAGKEFNPESDTLAVVACKNGTTPSI